MLPTLSNNLSSNMESEIIKTDICIIGAGPAGITASLTLAKQNIAHLLVDSSSFPRQKPCGDILTSNVLRALNEIDPTLIESLKVKNVINPIWKTIVYPPNGKQVLIDFLPFNKKAGEPSCYSISRFDFDNLLFLKATENKNTTVRQNFHVSSVEHQEDNIKLVSKNNETILAKLVIVATGSKNSILKQLGHEFPKKQSAVGIRAYYDGIVCDKENAELILIKEVMPSGIYITPLPNGTFNVNLVTFLEKVNENKTNLNKVFDSVIESNPLLKQKFKHATRIGKLDGSKLFMGVKKKIIAGDRYLIVGDSAGLIDIISGNGIPQAMISGKYAALRASEALRAGNFSKEFLHHYEIELHNKVQRYLLLGKILYPFLRIKLFCNIGLELLNYFANRPQTNFLLRDLLYDKNVKSKLLSPKFYYRLFIQ